MFNDNEEFNFGSYWTFFSSFKACKSIVHGSMRAKLCFFTVNAWCYLINISCLILHYNVVFATALMLTYVFAKDAIVV